MSAVILAIDGKGLAYRVFFGNPKRGLIGAFESAMNRAAADLLGATVVVAWEGRGPTWRHDLYPEYKAGRPEMPLALADQIPGLLKWLSRIGVATRQAPGFEADDVLATLARQAVENGDSIILLSEDKDVLQLARHGVTIRRSTGDWDEFRVYREFGVRPEQIPDWLALVGDKTDNVPGVPGIGENRAATILAQYPKIEALLASPTHLWPRQLAAETADEIARIGSGIRLAKRLCTLRDDAPVALEKARA